VIVIRNAGSPTESTVGEFFIDTMLSLARFALATFCTMILMSRSLSIVKDITSYDVDYTAVLIFL
jgi:hypothetical protein